MRKLLLIKKQKEWDKELEKEKVTLPIEEFYKKLDYKDKEIILNNKEILLKAIEQLNIKEKSIFINLSYNQVFKQPFIFEKVNLDNIINDYTEFLFELKEKLNLKLNLDLFISLSKLENIYYINSKYKIGKNLIEKIENNKELRKEIGNINILEEIKTNDMLNNIITRNIRYLTNLLKIKKSNTELDFNVKKYFDIETIKNF